MIRLEGGRVTGPLSLYMLQGASSEGKEPKVAFKPNYNHERAERERAKARKKAEKQAKRREGDGTDETAVDAATDAADAVASEGATTDVPNEENSNGA